MNPKYQLVKLSCVGINFSKFGPLGTGQSVLHLDASQSSTQSYFEKPPGTMGNYKTTSHNWGEERGAKKLGEVAIFETRK